MAEGRLDTTLEAAAAEFLVLGHLLMEGIECYAAYAYTHGHDLVALNRATGKTARIEVKSRWATNRAGSFSFKNKDCDFAVHVALNRGERRGGETVDATSAAPTYYIFPVDVIDRVRTKTDKVNISKIPDHETYIDAWNQIIDFLA